MVTLNRYMPPALRTWVLRVLPVALVVLISSNLFGQQYLATISGTVTDAAGAVIPGASVTAENDDTHFKTSTTSNQVGAYAIPFLTPGTYSVSVQGKGFRPAKRTDVVLHASDKALIDFQLSVGAETQSVEVSADLQALDTGTASLGQVLDKEEVVNLPNIGRNPFTEATLAAGTYSGNYVTGSSRQYNQPFSGTASQMQIGGLGNAHRLLLNGMPDDAPERLSAVTYTDFVPSPEAVQEVNTQTMLVDAQYGHSDGAVINTIIKTGQNQFHGAAYYIMRNEDIDANYTQNKTSSVARTAGMPPPDRWHQPGFVVDGPILLPKIYNGHDKSFFTVAWEHVLAHTPNPYSAWVPNSAVTSGNFGYLCSTFDSTGFCTNGTQIYDPNSPVDASGNRTNFFAYNNISSAINPIAAQMLKYFPAPNSTVGGNSYNYVSPDITIRDNYWSFITRVDQKLTAQQTLTGLFFQSQRHQSYPTQGFPLGGGIGSPGYVHTRNDTGASLDHIYMLSSSLVLDSRVGFVYHPFTLTNYGADFDITKLGFSSTLSSNLAGVMPRVTFPGLSFSGSHGPGYAGLQQGGGSFSQATSIAWSEVLTKQLGKHALKGGLELYDLRYNLASTGSTISNFGTFSFGTSLTTNNWVKANSTSGDPMASFMLGAPTGGSVTVNTAPAFQQVYYGLFLHDDWRVNNKLTLNIGIRWDYESPMTERHNRMNAGFCQTCSNPLQSSVTGLTLNGGLLFTSDKVRLPYNRQMNNWQPRFGAAYQVNPKLVLRGGMGLIYLPTFDQPGNTGFSTSTGLVATNNGYSPANSFSNPYASGITKPSGSSLGLLTQLGQGLSPEDVNHRQPRMVFGALGGEYQLPKQTVLEVSYVANLTRHMQVSKSINSLPLADYALGSAELTGMVANPMAGLIPSNSSLNGSTIQKQNLLVPFPEFGGITLYNRPLGFTSYNAMQLGLRKRFADGLSFQYHYTWSKQMNATTYLNGGTDNWDALFRRESSSPNRLWSAVASYDIPTLFKTNYWSRLWLGGWSIHLVARGNNGSLLGYPSLSGAQVDRIPGVSLRGGGSNRSMTHQFNTCYIDLNGVIQPGGYDASLASGSCGYGDPGPAWKTRTNSYTLASYGTVMSGVRQMVFPNADAAVYKQFKLAGKTSVELRGSFYNFTNTPNYNTPGTNLGTRCSHPANSTTCTNPWGAAGSMSWSQTNDPRTGEVAARINF